MAGMVLRVVPKRTLDFTNVSSGSGQSQEIVLVQIEIYAYLEGRTSEDPGILFTSSSILGVVTISNTVAAPLYSVTSLGNNVGSMIKIAARGTRTNSNASNAIKADISVDLSMKSA